ncbi:hypothetical protein I2486_09570 [Cellulophaga sp. E16_2]|uniref:hypothetical protein n=1 Tax=Cellulophaga sp. E16_2 TaxID=2789297 RepID=UPI001A939365|nr:hypothetical protein [Cellulophaga sp. E16_2]MBO0591655.1 hypothetical protein [Cellulophaga sp. E16_2]
MKKNILIIFSLIFLQSCVEKKGAETNKINTIQSTHKESNNIKSTKDIDPKIRISESFDSEKASKVYVSKKDGVWIKSISDLNIDLTFVEFNQELTPLKEGFVKTGNDSSLERRWILVKTIKGIGWIKSGSYGRKWCPEDLEIKSTSEKIITHIKHNKNINQFMSDKWDFVYHEDNRCDGSTDGFLDNLNQNLIDEKITIKVTNDGDGWACDKTDKKSYEMTFSLKQKISEWDRIELASYNDPCKKTVYILGKGESDYLKLHLIKIKNNYLISKLEYSSEDPG